MNYGDEFFLKAENYGEPDVSIKSFNFSQASKIQKVMYKTFSENDDRFILSSKDINKATFSRQYKRHPKKLLFPF